MKKRSTDHGILFQAALIRALLSGTKTQTRRLVTPANSLIDGIGGRIEQGLVLWERLDWLSARPTRNGTQWVCRDKHHPMTKIYVVSPVIEAGHTWWARETWSSDFKDHYPCEPIWFRADSERDIEVRDNVRGIWSPESNVFVPFDWHPSIHLKRCNARLTGRIEQVRAQRVQDISIQDATAEGITQTWGDFNGNPPGWALRVGEMESHFYDNRTSAENFALLWDSINTDPGDRWDDNPPVWAYTLSRNGSEVAK